jgi:hypothetical protein
MNKPDDLDIIYKECVVNGLIISRKSELKKKIKSMLILAEEFIRTINNLKKYKSYNTLFILNYDLIHILAEAITSLDKIKSANHQCLFAYICTKHSDLNLNWHFLEDIRLKRNQIHYYGIMVNQEHWQNIESDSEKHTSIMINYIKITSAI